jgi:exopolysaccharide biosynthesis polyprenyl glycosylphosphotransferase
VKFQAFKHHLYLTALKAVDILLMLVALAMSSFIGGRPTPQAVSVWDVLQVKLKVVNVVLLLLFIAIWHLVFLAMRLYDSRRLDRGKGEWKDIGKAVLIGSVVLLAAAVLFHRNNMDKNAVLLFAVCAGLLTWSGRALMRACAERLRRRNRNLHHLVLVGSNQRADDFVSRVMSKPHLGYRIRGYIDDPPNGQTYPKLALPLEFLGTLRDFETLIDREQVDEVVIALPIRSFYEQIQRIIEACELQGIQVHLLSDFFQLQLARARSTEFDGIAVLTLATGPTAVWPATLKRAFDMLVAGLLVLLLSPVLLLIALLIKIVTPQGPVFFVQTRVGYNRRRFKLFKFRTMVPEAEQLQAQLENLNEAQGPVFKIKHDPRITPIGRWLRKTSLDELPQLFNVITGDMSLVGPRPLPLRDVERFEASWLKRRFSVRPGITCLWQVSGRSNSSFDKWIEQDLDYIDHWSFGLDLKILFRTIPAVLRGVGAH